MVSRYDRILVGRLYSAYDPFSALFGDYVPKACYSPQTEPAEFITVEARWKLSIADLDQWNCGRIAFFRRALRRRKKTDPIELDNEAFRWSLGGPIVTDGHHRLCAAILEKRRHIRCSYSGLVKTLQWLKGAGRRDRPPFA